MTRGRAGLGVVNRTVVGVPARDGTTLAADLYLPDGAPRAPALVLRTPYGRRYAEAEVFAHPSWYARRGFAVLVQDCRGRGDSGGEFEPYASEAHDGQDTVEWAAAQPWCSGEVGMYGFSYPGTIELLAAAEAPRGLRAIAPAMAGSSFGEGWTYRNGALQLAFVLSWSLLLAWDSARRASDLAALERIAAIQALPEELYGRLPVRSAFPEELRRHAPFLRGWLDHPPGDAHWDRWAPREAYAAVATPALHIAGWYDIFLQGTIENFTGLTEHGAPGQQLVIGPWQHYPWARHTGACDFGPEAASDVDERQAAFFERRLRDDPVEPDRDPAVSVFVMGLDSWREMSRWPPPDAAAHRLYLRSGGRANSLNGDGALSPEPPPDGEAPDVYASNPADPVRSEGGSSCCDDGSAPMGPADQTRQELRNDMLVYESEPLERPLVVIGAPSVVLHAVTDADSVDYVVRLVDACPSGVAIGVTEGNVRLAPADRPADRVREVEIALAPTAIRLAPGHRIRLEVAGSSFPAYDRNPQSTTPPADATWLDFRVATQQVFHDAGRPSRLELPVVDS